ncbi:short-chain dehydrogenase [Boletus reticuloceps]|uniref:Short-chain dehydrogenase n=1 Tax=Boletus reticuloceps TaxID=495285 RepID=A0A8I2YTU4_9AGAM|nr:short-chain dehydrogenase [Boletus reticuloceps]
MWALRLLLTTRNEAKCKQAKQDVEQCSVTNNIEAWSLELGSFDSVRKFADRIQSEGFPINAFIANASIATFTYVKMQDGWETMLQVNYLSTALLSILMLPHLIKSMMASDTARLVIVTSDAHFRANKLKGVANWPSILRKLNDDEYCTASDALYTQGCDVHSPCLATTCQVLQVMFVREPASWLPNPTPVSTTSINPGFCHSHLTRSIESNLVMKLMVHVGKALLARTTEMGSRALVHPAVEPSERDRHGRYVSCVEVAKESDYALSEEGKEISRHLWPGQVVIINVILRIVRRICLPPSDYQQKLCVSRTKLSTKDTSVVDCGTRCVCQYAK